MRRFVSPASTFVLAGLVLFAGLAMRQSAAQEVKSAPATKKPAKARGRLPAFYNQVVTEEQREEIYAVQQKYSDEIDRLEAMLNDLIDKRDTEVAGVLTAEQLEQVNQLAAAAKARQGAAREAPTEAEAPGATAASEDEVANSEEAAVEPAKIDPDAAEEAKAANANVAKPDGTKAAAVKPSEPKRKPASKPPALRNRKKPQ